ncbi:PIN domain-like protein [Meira miltonrushii]|uniref:PIN domain-like protein n=1 Tax=Meira miltonrushii TaxID=1280837 RepID=A0A316VNA9_9BASI|nr:PIN domain-like protein [Meira miltonrushii]PWN37045.1 PIN domain-like protein [Meira miltonrushii]
MHATQVLNGIRGIFPLIKQHAPQCITTLRSFAALPRQTRLAIDATLLVQRLHFAEDHEDRHAIGFRRLLKQFREHDLVPIMVFDGVGQGARLPAKMREHEKRRSRRGKLTLRAKIEAQRAKRLKRLQVVLQKWSEMTKEQRIRTAILLQKWNDNDNLESHISDPEDWAGDFLDQQAASFSTDDEILQTTQISNLERMASDTLRSMHEHIDGQERQWSDGIKDSEEKEMLSDPLAWKLIAEQMSSDRVTPSSASRNTLSDDQIWSQVKEAEDSTEMQLAAQVWALSRQHAEQAARAGTMARTLNTATEWPAETPSQQQMTLAEDKVYKRLIYSEAEVGDSDRAKTDTEDAHETNQDILTTAHLSSTAEKEASAATAEAEASEDEPSTSIFSLDNVDLVAAEQLSLISERNQQMQRSYSKSSAALSPCIFTESASVCEAFGVPVLWTGDGTKGAGRPHEAEAMASMLVRHGYADMVASEDSDVLLYDVPLLRGVMGHKKLELIDSSAVRKAFFPPINKSTDDTSHLTPASAFAMSDEIEEISAEQQTTDNAGQLELLHQNNANLNDADRLSRRQMLDFALLCGTDFNRTIPGIGPRRALSLIRDYGSIDGIRQEAANRAIQEKRKKVGTKVKQQSTQTIPTPPIGSLVSSVRTQSGQLRLPDDVTWREFSKELTQARRVFEHPPTLFWQARKIRNLKRSPNGDPAEVIEENKR